MHTEDPIADEMRSIFSYVEEFLHTKKLLIFIDKLINDNFLQTLRYEENKVIFEKQVIFTLNSIAEKIAREIRENKIKIPSKANIWNSEMIDSSKEYLTINSDIFYYFVSILNDKVDFTGKREIFIFFYEKYLSERTHEAISACIPHFLDDNVDSFLDLYNSPRYSDVRENTILPILGYKMAEQLSVDEIIFKNIDEAKVAYDKDKSFENLAQLKKLEVMKITEDTQNCDDRQELGKMLSNADSLYIRGIIIGRLASLDIES